MELIHSRYRATTVDGSGIVSGEAARSVWESWDPNRRGGSLETGFVVWDVSERPGPILTSTSYIPVGDDAE